MMAADDGNTVTTSDFLDLIQADASNPSPQNASGIREHNSYNNKAHKSDTDARYSTVSESWRGRSRESNLFRVRLTRSPESRRRRDLEEQEENRADSEARKYHRQKMPLNGGYGGMFDAGVGQFKKDRSDNDLEEEEGTTTSEATGSAISTAFSLATGLFSRGGSVGNTKGKKKARGGTTLSRSAKRSNRPPSELFSSLPKWCIKISALWLRMPFQFRYFLQLLSIASVFLLASLNYFIAVDDGRPNSLETAVMEGGGASPDRIPSLHLKKPFQYLHSEVYGSLMLEKAKIKLLHSTRIGADGSGPFAYGWKSMPPQIFNDFDSALVQGDQTIEHPNSFKGGFDVKVFPPKGTVAYVLPVTTCYDPTDDPDTETADMQHFFPDSPNQPIDEDSFRDYALMLRAMVHSHSYQNPASGSMYDYKMHALISPNTKECTDKKGNTADRAVVLQNLGYEVSIVRPPQIKPETIESEFLRNTFIEHGQGKVNHLSDLIRLHAYELEEYNAVVLVDYDTLILGSVDDAIDLVNDPSKGEDGSVNAVFSWKHVRSLGHPQYRTSVINLSFFILRPSKETYAKLRKALRSSPFSEARGWGSIGRGPFPGWMTTQGFLTYYYDEIDNASKVEMNRCTFGNTGESPTNRHTKSMDSSSTELITNAGKVDCEKEQAQWANQCQDCSKSDLHDIMVADLSYCIAPWKCGEGGAQSSSISSSDKLSSALCRKFQKSWYGARLQMEDAHPQLQKGRGNICVGGDYQPMKKSGH